MTTGKPVNVIKPNSVHHLNTELIVDLLANYILFRTKWVGLKMSTYLLKYFAKQKLGLLDSRHICVWNDKCNAMLNTRPWRFYQYFWSTPLLNITQVLFLKQYYCKITFISLMIQSLLKVDHSMGRCKPNNILFQHNNIHLSLLSFYLNIYD